MTLKREESSLCHCKLKALYSHRTSIFVGFDSEGGLQVKSCPKLSDATCHADKFKLILKNPIGHYPMVVKDVSCRKANKSCEG